MRNIIGGIVTEQYLIRVECSAELERLLSITVKEKLFQFNSTETYGGLVENIFGISFP